MPHKHRIVWIRCDWCGKPKKVRTTDRKRGKGRFCSRKCAGLWWAQQQDFPFNKDQTGENNPNWRGGKTKHCKGYIYAYAPDHPRQHNGYVLEHILVAEKRLGRRLEPGEVVHHKDGNKANNHPDNIKIFKSAAEHSQYHWKARKEVANGQLDVSPL